MFFPSFGEENRIASIFMGVKGIVSFELKSKGGDWGGPTDRGSWRFCSLGCEPCVENDKSALIDDRRE